MTGLYKHDTDVELTFICLALMLRFFEEEKKQKNISLILNFPKFPNSE